ncbi:amino acid-binding protein [Burkholderia diffusa]|uniref:Amino acid-binding protein n=1 Tax=Burkholderia diffusa TaxID=488732 RepID=A0AAW3PIE1_9BURK|nr:ACT domain-containing protein [Burkholderia diffusa]KVN02319.1 amino acid-binding protein [Burkholderia diffusa]KWF36775.1 amino acid-binding protein [Burkholderia diffusa]KWF42499.1 amino acid-binding protein [Burkholderia diffusa]KWF48270.1 amino acid-binding protein [Burkholderia diffusa]KWF55552.1 amino acid-binding protein [Burkholderia diffusa]
MELSVERVDVWAATIEDKPGGLAHALNALRDAGADLQFVVARRTPEAPGKGVVFVAPLQGDKEIRAATQAGFNATSGLHSIRVMGLDQAGIIAELTQKLSDAGINLRGVSAAVLGSQFIAYLALDSLAEAERAMDILQRA